MPDIYVRNTPTGGGVTSVDILAHASLETGDLAYVFLLEDLEPDTGNLLMYRYDSTLTDAETGTPPSFITPDDAGGSPGRWKLFGLWYDVTAIEAIQTAAETAAQNAEDWAEADIGDGAPGTSSASAKQWAEGTGVVDGGTGRSSKYWAEQAQLYGFNASYSGGVLTLTSPGS